MKIVALVVCAWAAAVEGGAVAWPGATPVALTSPFLKTVLPPQTKSFAYSTTQYINALPVSYQLGLRPQYSYQIPHLSPFAPIQPGYYPAPGASYYPASIFYPPVAPVAPITPISPVSPIAPQQPVEPQQPIGSGPSLSPQQPAGDADTAVVDSAEFPQQEQGQQFPAADSPQSQIPPASTFPNFPQFGSSPQGSDSYPQIPQGFEPSYPQAPQESITPSLPQRPQEPGVPSNPQAPPGSGFPSFPQFPEYGPSYPQIPQGLPSFPQFPQNPQGSVPGFPQFPQFPSNPLPQPQPPSPSPPSSTFPSAEGDDKGLNDEDTISVESA